MHFEKKNPPRAYQVGFDNKSTILDCGTMHLLPDEQITFVTESGRNTTSRERSGGSTPRRR